jgi:hypothetical protein
MLQILLARQARRFGVTLKAVARGVRSVIRRASERDRLSGLSRLERRDLRFDRVDHELKKWPWQG